MEYDENVQAMVNAAPRAMEVAFMYPVDDRAAVSPWSIRPDGWDLGSYKAWLWPEVRGVPLTQEQIAAAVQDALEAAARSGTARFVIVSRSDAAFYRLRRMVAEGAALDVKVYLVRDDGQLRCDVNGYGVVDPWPGELFGHVAHECGAILRAQRRQRAARAAAPAKPTEGT